MGTTTQPLLGGLVLLLLLLTLATTASSAAPSSHNQVNLDVYDGVEGGLVATLSQPASPLSTSNVSVDVYVYNALDNISRTCVTEDEEVEVTVSHIEQSQHLSCLYLPSDLVSEIWTATEELAVAEVAYLESNRLAQSKFRKDGQSSGVLFDRSQALLQEREVKKQQRQLALSKLVSEALHSQTLLATSSESAPSGEDRPVQKHQTRATCRVPLNLSKRFALATLSSNTKLKDGEAYWKVLVEGAHSAPFRLHLALPSPEQMIDKMSVKGILPRAVDKEGGEVLVWGQGFQEGLRCSVGGGAAGESYAQVLNESCALCSIPRGVEEDGSPDQYTSIDLYYNPLCRNKIEVYRYDRPKVLSAETLGASRYSEIVVLLELERAEVDRLVRMPELTPSCRLRSTRAGDLFEMAAEIVQANSTVRCSVGDDRIVEGSYELSFSVNDVQYGFFGHTVRVRSAEMWIESVHFDGASDDVVAKVRIEGSFSSEEVFAQMQLTLTTLATGREQKVLYPLSWDGQGREKVVRIKLPESMRPTLFSTLDLSISRSEGVSIRVEGPKVLWNPATIIEGFALESQCILNSREQESASVKVMAPGHAQFEAAGLVLKTSGGSAIPAYHYRVSQVTQTLVKGNDSCVAGDSGLGLVEQACGVELDVEVFWHNIKPADFLTIGVELSYQQNHEVLRVAFPNAIQLWGLSEDSGSCPSGFSEEGLVGPEEALDYTAFGFGLARKELEALSMYPPYNPTVRKYSALTFEDKVWIHSPLNWKNSGGMDLRLTFQAYENAVTVDFPRPNWFMIPLNLKEGENKATLSITSPTNQAATFDLDVYRSDPSNYIKSMTLQTRHENKTLCAHNSTRDYPLCIPGSHLFQQVTMSEAIYLEVESNATLTSPFIVGHNATENGLTRYALSHKLLEEHTFSIGHDMVLNSKQRISITIDWKAEGGHNFLVNKVYDRPEPVDPNDNGFQLQAAFPACEVCPSGYFSGKINSTFCEPCRAGYFSGSPGRGICESCKPGYYSMDYANEKCDPCLRGLYMPKPGGKECFECPKNATTSARGSMSCTLIEEKEKWLPTIVVEFSVTVNATNLSDVGKKFGVQDISDERAIEVLMKDDTATAFSSTAHNVSVSDVNVWVTELEHGLIQAKINVTLVPNITLKSSEKERAEAMKQLSDISADKGINLLADNPDQFFGRTLEAINGTSTVENILQRQTPYSRRGKKDLLAVHWIISVSIFTGFSCVLFTKRVRKRCYKRASKGKVERERRHRKTKSMGALRMVI